MRQGRTVLAMVLRLIAPAIGSLFFTGTCDLSNGLIIDAPGIGLIDWHWDDGEWEWHDGRWEWDDD